MVKSILFSIGVVFGAHAQDLSFEVPERLTFSNECEEIFPLLSADGRELYFVRTSCLENVGGKNGGSDIWISEWIGPTSWSVAHNGKSSLNNKYNNSIVGVGQQSGTLFQLNTKPTTSISGINPVKKIGGVWKQSQIIPVAFLETQEFIGLYIDKNERIMLLSMEKSDSRGEEDLYVSFRNSKGTWSTPRNLGLDINTRGFEISPFLSADTKRLYFSSNGHGGVGDADIFYSDRLDDSWENWSEPVNLININTAFFDAYFSFYDSIAFFSSNRDGQFSDLYQVRIRKPQNKEDQEAKRIMAEAKLLLNDLRDDTTDSLRVDEQISIIEFEANSSRIENATLTQLKSLVTDLQEQPVHKITLVTFSNDSDLQHVQLSLKRLELVKKYFDVSPIASATVETEVIKQDKNWFRKKDFIEVRYK